MQAPFVLISLPYAFDYTQMKIKGLLKSRMGSLPGLILFVFLFFSQYYVLFEGDSIVESLKKGWHLVRGRWFAVAIRLLIPIILIGILQILLDEILQYLIVDNLFTGPREAATMLMPVLVSGGLRALTTSFFYPWLYGATILLYLELKRTPHI